MKLGPVGTREGYPGLELVSPGTRLGSVTTATGLSGPAYIPVVAIKVVALKKTQFFLPDTSSSQQLKDICGPKSVKGNRASVYKPKLKKKKIFKMMTKLEIS